MSGLDVLVGISCNLAGDLQLTSGSLNEPDPFVQVLCLQRIFSRRRRTAPIMCLPMHAQVMS